jgi:hypothetical protein
MLEGCLVRVDKLHCSSTTVEALERRYWKSSMAHDPRLLAGIVYDSPAKYELSNRVGRLTRENCRRPASISPTICSGSLGCRAEGLNDSVSENLCRLQIANIRSFVFHFCTKLGALIKLSACYSSETAWIDEPHGNHPVVFT